MEKTSPLAYVTAEKRSDKRKLAMEFLKNLNVSHIFADLDYEVDELRGDVKIAELVEEEQDLSKQVRAPGERLGRKEYDRLRYPRPHVEFGEIKVKRLARYKEGRARANAFLS